MNTGLVIALIVAPPVLWGAYTMLSDWRRERRWKREERKAIERLCTWKSRSEMDAEWDRELARKFAERDRRDS